jgi:outer membrane lipoprotein-sorting protein
MTSESKTRLLRQIADEKVSESLDLWPSVQQRLADAPTAADGSGRFTGQRWLAPRRLALGFGAAVALALAAVVAVPWVGGTNGVSAEAILDHTAQAVNGPLNVTSYHLTLVHNVGGPGAPKAGGRVQEEVWYNGSGQQRSDEQDFDASGAVVASSEVVFNGAETWIAHGERGGQPMVIHTTGTTPPTVMHTNGTTWTKPADSPASQASLSDILARYSNLKGCASAQLSGEGTVAGQAAYVIIVTPRAADCGPGPASFSKSSVQPDPGNGWQMKVWVDKTSFLPLKTEIRDAAGQLVDSSEVTSIQYNQAIPSSTFSYTPPAGVTVATFTGGDGRDVKAKLAGQPAPASPKQPSK